MDQDHPGCVPPPERGASRARRRRHLLRPVPAAEVGRGSCWRCTTGSRSASAPSDSAPAARHPPARWPTWTAAPPPAPARSQSTGTPSWSSRCGRPWPRTCGPRSGDSGIACSLAAEQRFEEAATIRGRLDTLIRTGARFHRVGSLAACPEIVAARRNGDEWEIHVIRYGRLAAAELARPGRRPAGGRPRRSSHRRDRARPGGSAARGRDRGDRTHRRLAGAAGVAIDGAHRRLGVAPARHPRPPEPGVGARRRLSGRLDLAVLLTGDSGQGLEPGP